MESDIKFDKLVENITKQQQQKSDLEAALKHCDAQRKGLESELTALQHKEESLNRQIPELKQDIARQNAAKASMTADLAQLKTSRSKLLESVEVMKGKVSQLQKEIVEEEQDGNNNLGDIEEKLNANRNALSVLLRKDI